MRLKTSVFLLTLLVTSAAAAQTVDEIIQKYVEATGGYEKWKSIQSIKMTGTVQVQNIEMPFVRYGKRPNKFRLEATMQGQTMVQAYDGKTAWWIFPFMGSLEPQIMPQEQAEEIILQADLEGPFIDYKKKGHKIELLGKEDVEGTEAYKLKITYKNGTEVYSYLDAEYFLEIRQVTRRRRRGREIEIVSNLGDYKKVGGVLLPHSMTVVTGPRVTSVTVDSVEWNVDLKDDFFTMPKKNEKK